MASNKKPIAKLSTKKTPEPKIKKVDSPSHGRIMKSFRIKTEVYAALLELRQRINKQTSLNLSAIAILELLIVNAAQRDIKYIIDMIQVNPS